MAIRVVWAVTLRREHRGKLIQLALPSCGASHRKSAMADLRTSIPISGTPEIGGRRPGCRGRSSFEARAPTFDLCEFGTRDVRGHLRMTDRV